MILHKCATVSVFKTLQKFLNIITLKKLIDLRSKLLLSSAMVYIIIGFVYFTIIILYANDLCQGERNYTIAQNLTSTL